MLLSLLQRYLRPYRHWVVAVLVLQLVGTIASLYLPSLNADIIDRGITRGDTGYILRTGGWMLAVSLVQIVCTIAAVYFGARTAMSFGRDLRAEIFAHVGRFSGREVADFGAPSLITRNTNDVQQVQMLVAVSATMFVAAPIMGVGGIVMALREDVGLSWLMVVAVPVLVVSIGLIARRMIPQFRAMQQRIDAVNRILREQISGIRVVRAFVREDFEQQRFSVANAELTATAVRAGRLMVLIFPIVLLVLNASSVAVLWFGGQRVDAGQMEIGSLTAFLAYLMQILISVMMATFLVMMIPRAAVCADRIGEVLDAKPSVTPPAYPVTQVATRGELELRGVGFTYPGAADPVLRDITCRVGPGETLAVVGSTGAGKTTLISLIARLIDVSTGAVLVDGVDVRDLAPEMLWSRIGLVPQQAYLFSGTVASNLRFGSPDASDGELWAALEIAQAAGFVTEMGGLDSAIAQGGTNVSGGQRQRLCIARALVVRPEIYLFDDSFSALDLATDARLRAALRPHTADSAVVVVAQRVSTIVDADQILVLEDGEVVGVGTHEELLTSCPTYQEIVESQVSAEAAA